MGGRKIIAHDNEDKNGNSLSHIPFEKVFFKWCCKQRKNRKVYQHLCFWISDKLTLTNDFLNLRDKCISGK